MLGAESRPRSLPGALDLQQLAKLPDGNEQGEHAKQMAGHQNMLNALKHLSAIAIRLRHFQALLCAQPSTDTSANI